ncbi:MAG: GNAT family N-acetyltransferase [Candidatus Auribacter fodinae]|jgi:Zn-dependent peptidase ImmA (M78 family)|uniref:GNAT family N-acetyltransferase n=1 Tax=Candidatus Auribacter fodinae TaxID=2093366 RepID=A0A3A4RAP3_9BACT|nr:MAG: GNAT family N-acetyltransferase [Candidatus Auribacter fodinae]
MKAKKYFYTFCTILFLITYCAFSQNTINHSYGEEPAISSRSETAYEPSLREILDTRSYSLIDWYKGNSNVFILNIQDFHGNYATQKKYSALFESLIKSNHTFNIKYIAVEGASGIIDTTTASTYPDEATRNEVANQFLNRGFISGIEYYSITADDAPPIIGIDDASLYRKNAELFLRLQDENSEEIKRASAFMSFVQQESAVVINTILSEDERIIVTAFTEWVTSRISSLEYLQQISTVKHGSGLIPRYASLDRLRHAVKLQTEIMYDQLEREKLEFLHSVHAIILPDEYNELSKNIMRASVGSIASDAVYAKISEIAERYSLSLDTYPTITSMTIISKAFSSVTEQELRKDLFSFTTELVSSVPGHHQSITDILAYVRMTAVIDAVTQTRASREEYDFYKSQFESASAEKLLDTFKNITGKDLFEGTNDTELRNVDYILSMADQFYQEALKRDQLLLENSLRVNQKLNGKTIVMVTGGFHSDGIAALLKERSISYAIIRPYLGAGSLESNYKSLMFNQTPAFDHILSALPGMLMPSSNFRNILYPANKAVLLAKWIIISEAINLARESQKQILTAEYLASSITAHQTKWLEELRSELDSRYKPLITAGIATPKDIDVEFERFREILNAIEFDRNAYAVYNLIPIVIHGETPHRIILSVSPDSTVTPQLPDFIDLLDDYKNPYYHFRIWNEAELEHYTRLSDIIESKDLELSTEARQNILVLMDLFGLETVDQLIEDMPSSALNSLLESLPDYEELKQFVTMAGHENATELLIWDPQGFFNLVYTFENIDDTELQTNYIELLLSQRPSYQNGAGKMPEFVIQQASLYDVDEWMQYGIPRTFSREHWESADTNDFFYKAMAANGTVIGLISARIAEGHNLVYVDFLETCSTVQHKGIGTALIKSIVAESLRSGFDGSVALDPQFGSKPFYTKLGFIEQTKGNTYLLLPEENALKLLGSPEDIKRESKVKIDEQRLAEIASLPQLQIIEQIIPLFQRYNSLTNDNKLLLISQLMAVYNLNQEQALNELYMMLSSPSVFTNKLTELYDLMMDTWITSQETTDELPNAVIRPTLGQLPDEMQVTFPLFHPKYTSVLFSLIELNKTTSPTSFDAPLRDTPSALKFIRYMLQQNALFMDVVAVPENDPRISGKTATLEDNILYINENATRAELWFYLPHEISHLFKNETAARLHDADNINHLKNIAKTLREVAVQLPVGERKDMLIQMSSAVMKHALSFELDIHTAYMQLTTPGKNILRNNNLPYFDTENELYLASIAGAASRLREPVTDLKLFSEIEKLAADASVSVDQLTARVNRIVTRKIINNSLEQIKPYQNDIDEIIQNWLKKQIKHRLWHFTTHAMPRDLRPFVTTSSRELGYLDINDIRTRIVAHIRSIEDPKAKADFEEIVAKWLKRLISDNIKSLNLPSDLRSALNDGCSNCLGYAKLYRALGFQFGLNIEVTLYYYETNDVPHLHAANLVLLSDGHRYLTDIGDLTQYSPPSHVCVQLESSTGLTPATITMQDYLIHSRIIRGVPEEYVSAFGYSNKAYDLFVYDSRVEQAFHAISKAYALAPGNPYIASNMAEISFSHWKRSLTSLGIQPSQEELLDKLRELYEQYQLHINSMESLNNYYKAQLKSAARIAKVEMVNPINGGNGNFRFPLYQNVQKKQEPAETAETQKPQTPSQPVDRETAAKNDAMALDHLQRMGEMNRIAHGITPTQQGSKTENALFQYKVNQLLGTGIDYNTARSLIQTGAALQKMIEQQQFQQVNARLTGLDPHFAERIMIEFPYIMAYLLEIYPEWWKGKELRELARQHRLTEEVKAMVRKQMTTVTATQSSQDRDNIRRPYEFNPLWTIARDRAKLLNSLERAYEQDRITDQQYRAIYSLLTADSPVSKESLSYEQRRVLFGKEDEIPVPGGLSVSNNFILGDTFIDVPKTTEFSTYASFLTTLVDEHPQELALVLNDMDQEPFLAGIVAARKGKSFSRAHADARGGLSSVADDLLSSISGDQIESSLESISESGYIRVFLEELFTSNILRKDIQAFVRSVQEKGILSPQEKTMFAYFNNYYITGDENTKSFRDGITLVEQLFRIDNDVRDQLTALQAQLRDADPGKFLFALITSTYYDASGTLVSPTQPASALRGYSVRRDLLEQAL